jgi:hypothetical protein
MDSRKGTKRARTARSKGGSEGGQSQSDLVGREQLLLSSPELRNRLGKKYCDEAELMPLLLSYGLVRRVRTIQVEIRPLGGDSFTVALDASQPSVGELKAEINRLQGRPENQQELYKVAQRADGKAVREDDAEPELLDDKEVMLKEGETLAMAVKEPPFVWSLKGWEKWLKELGWHKNHVVTLTEGNSKAAIEIDAEQHPYLLLTSGVSMKKGRHYWEVELLDGFEGIGVGVAKPNLNPLEWYGDEDCTDGWFIFAENGALCGNGKCEDDVKCEDGAADAYASGDRVGILLDAKAGSLLFFKNGVQNGPGYAAGSVTAPVVHAIQVGDGDCIRVVADVAWPASHPE